MFALIATSLLVLAQGNVSPRCRANLQTMVLAQQSYQQIEPMQFRGNNRWFVYVPDIKTPFIGAGWRSFPVWIIEGVYGAPLPRPQGQMKEDV